MKTYKCRWVGTDDESELVNLYHLAATALCGKGNTVTRHDRMIWASQTFANEHRYLSSTAAYKDLEGLLA